MNVIQMWIVVGVPGLVIAGALFVGHSRLRAIVGYVVLAGLVGAFVSTPGGGASAAAIGVLGVVLVAVGRGTFRDVSAGEHHDRRRRFTTAKGV